MSEEERRKQFLIELRELTLKHGIANEADFKDIPVIGIREDGRFYIHADNISKTELMHEIEVMERFYLPLLEKHEGEQG